jgi:hypothetical protein
VDKMLTTKGLKNFIGIFLLGGLISCAQTSEIELPGFSYLSKTIPLDVADVVVVTEAQPSQTKHDPLLEVSILQTLEDWAKKRFVAVGRKGKALITIKQAETLSGGLKRQEDIHVLLNSEKPDYFGAKVLVSVDIVDTEPYAKGQAEAFLERKVIIESDVKLAFRRRLWQQFSQTFMNAFDEQMLLNLETYLPKVLVK